MMSTLSSPPTDRSIRNASALTAVRGTLSRALLPVASLFALCALAVPQQAAAYWVDFCADYRVAYADGDSGVGDDYFTNNNNKPARGARIRVTENSSGTDVFNDYTPYEDPGTGCTGDLWLVGSESYTVKILADASVRNNTIEVRGPGGGYWASTWASSFTPTATETIDITTGLHDAWNIAAAAGWAMKRRTGGVSGETFTFFNQACPGGTGNCNSGGDIYVITTDSKYVIVHEMGHRLARFANNDNADTFSYLASPDACHTNNPGGTGHEINSKEYQSAAAMEGIASYYAAVAFNKTNEFDCNYASHRWIDWDLDGVQDEPTVDWDSDGNVDYWPFNCEGAAIAGQDAKDYLGDYCLGSGVIWNRGTQYDWIRFFWDLDTEHSLGASDIFNLWDDANPHNWSTSSDLVWVPITNETPWFRLYLAADAAGFGPAFIDEAGNGVWR